jgi:2-methylcitrate dehydratase PrpD
MLAAALLPESAGTSRLIGDGRATGCRTAALINGTAAHSAEIDDIFRDGIYHPGSPTIAAAFAVAERQRSSGADLLRAVTVGYETGNRIAAAVNPSHYRYWHTTGTIGTIGAAAAAAEILCLEADQWGHALTTAATMAAGLQQAFRSDSMSKPLHAGHAAEAGTLAALLAHEGFTGAGDVFEGPAGFGAAMSEDPDWGVAVAALERSPTILETTVKQHACCGHAFAAIDAVLELRSRGVRADDVATIIVQTYSAATTVAGGKNPTTAFEAKFSIAYCVAAALITGSVQLPTFDEPVLSQPDIRDLARRVELVAHAEMDAAFPHRRSARVIVHDRSGTVHVAERTTRKGDPDDPLNDDEISAKFMTVVAPVIGAAHADRLRTSLWNLGSIADVSALPLAAAERATSGGSR